MCVPTKSQRKKQKTNVVLDLPPKEVAKRCDEPVVVVHTLVRLDVVGAIATGELSWEVVNDTRTITITATTAPDSADVWGDLEWSVDDVDGNNRVVTLDRKTVRKVMVSARLPGQDWLHKEIAIVDLVDITCDLPIKLTDRERHWKAYESNATTTLTASTLPDDDAVWQVLNWDILGVANTADVNLAVAGEKSATVTLGQAGPKSLTADIHVCKWPKLQLRQLSFDSYPVYNDGATEIDKEFDAKWVRGRSAPEKNCVTADVQSPLLYVQNETIKVTATFKATVKPTDPEKVKIRGQATVGGVVMEWATTVDVGTGSNPIVTAQMSGSNPLAPGVARHNSMKIEWFMIESDQVTWTSIGTTRHLLYVTLDVPQADPYWTLLDISCRAAAGTTTEAAFVPAAFVPFTTHTGDGNGFRRMGDGVRMSYYKQGTDTSGDQTEPSTYSTFGILSRPDGTGRCGGWANLLIHLFKIHGVTSAGKRWYIRGKDKNNRDKKLRFLVKTCAFKGAGSKPGPYTHLGHTECVKQDGVPGQGKTNPQFDFGDHVVVKHGGKLYDPSYGVGPKDTDLEYEQEAIAGLGTFALIPSDVDFTMGDGTVQFISGRCSAGFVEHKMTGADTVSSVALTWGMTESSLFDHAYNAALKLSRVTADKAKTGDVLYIPRSPTMQMLDGYDL